ncbi:ABC transporter substrate-binding protein [Thermococcus litoralis]
MRNTVKIYLKEPYAPFLYMIASSIYIVPKHLWENVDKNSILQYKNEKPIGSGPFIFVEHKPQQYYKLKANPNYHLGRPLIDEIVMPIISNPDAMLMAFKKGEVDVMTWSIPYSSIPQVEKIPDAHLHAVTEFGARFMYFNCQRWPMSEVKFRQAVHHAINQTEVVKVVYQGHALPGSLGRIPPTLKEWYNPNLPSKEEKYPFNLQKAAQLLDEIGFKDVDGDGWRETPDGSDITLTIYSPSYDPLRVRWGQMIAENLKKIGVNVKYQPLEWTTLSNYLDSGNFDMLIIGGIGSLDPDILRMLFHSQGGWNEGHCVIPGLDELLDKQRYTVDYEKRKKIVYKIQEILTENVPLLNMVHQQFIFAYSTKNWEGWVLSDIMGPDNWFSLMNLYNKEINKQQSIQTSEVKQSVSSSTSTKSQTPSESKGGICGPASLIGLALLPIILRKRK